MEVAYDGRSRAVTVTNLFDSSVTAYDYNNVGMLDLITQPNGVTLDFVYESTYGRLDRIIDPDGNYIQYAYDAQGNRTEVSYYKADNTRVFWKRFDYQHPDQPGKLWKEINTDNTFAEYFYNTSGAISAITDVAGNTTSYNYDLFKRLTNVTQPGATITGYDYDTHGNLKSVTDAENHITSYDYDDRGRRVQTTSPDTGMTSCRYDAAGNLVAKADANGITATYTYDALNRLTNINFPDEAQNITYTYDQGPNGKGRLTGMVDASGTTVYRYDAKGNLYEVEKTVDGVVYITSYTYDAAGLLTGITLPDGRVVTYELDTAGRVQRITTTKDTTTTLLAGNITYMPFGPVTAMDLGSGIALNQAYDDLYRPSTITAGSVQDLSYNYYPEGNIDTITNNVDPTRSQDFTYDDLYRLTDAAGVYGNVGFTYDKVGNRLSRTKNGQTDNYSYETGTNRLSSITGTNARNFTYDAAGNMIHVDTRPGGSGSAAKYTYNGHGQRIKKEAGGVTTIYHYDLAGNLIGESDAAGQFSAVYVYLGNLRIAAVIKVGSDETIFYYLNDHSGTPQKMIDQTNAVVWAADYLPFGKVNVTINAEENNFRFPGQFFDSETGLHYNWHRYYDPKTGRYLRPDPIGLEGGINLFTYVLNDPINLIDPLGLVNWKAVGTGAIATFGGGVTVVTGALASTSGVGAVGGVPAVLVGSAGIGWGVSQIITGFTDNELPFMGTKEAIIKGTTEPGLLQDELLGINTLGDMLLTGRTAPTDIGKIDSVTQRGHSIYNSGSTIVNAINNTNNSTDSSPCK